MLHVKGESDSIHRSRLDFVLDLAMPPLRNIRGVNGLGHGNIYEVHTGTGRV